MNYNIFFIKFYLGPPTNLCTTSSCGRHGKCNSLSNGYVCECFDGYSGINCEFGKLYIICY